MSHAYTEDQFVEQPTIGLFDDLGWQVIVPQSVSSVAQDAGLLGRETRGEVVLVARLQTALEKLYSALPPEAITAAVEELICDRDLPPGSWNGLSERKEVGSNTSDP